VFLEASVTPTDKIFNQRYEILICESRASSENKERKLINCQPKILTPSVFHSRYINLLKLNRSKDIADLLEEIDRPSTVSFPFPEKHNYACRDI
jgi:hypothetical protein